MPETSRITFSHITALQIHRFLKSSSPKYESAWIPFRMRHASSDSLSVKCVATTLFTALQGRIIAHESAASADSTLAELSSEGIATPLHIVTATKGLCRRQGAIAPHLFCAQAPSNAFFKLSDRCFICSPEFAFVQVASSGIDFISLVELGYKLCGTYQTERTGLETQFELEPITSTRRLREFVRNNPSIRGARIARNALRYIADNSASPRETTLSLLFGLPLRRGGYGFGIPAMNRPVALNERARAIALRASLRCDLCWPEHTVDVEYQSTYAHYGEEARIRDSRRSNALASMGWTVINVTNEEIRSTAACDAIAEAIRKAMKKQARKKPDEFAQRNCELRKKLGLPF